MFVEVAELVQQLSRDVSDLELRKVAPNIRKHVEVAKALTNKVVDHENPALRIERINEWLHFARVERQ